MTEIPRDTPAPLIEQWFPVGAVDEACGTTVGSGQNEKAIFTWFASRPIAQARAAVITSLLAPAGEEPSPELLELVNEAIITGNAGALEKVAAEIPDVSGARPVVLDCFSGRGIIPLEAARLGLRSVGLDWSPVAILASRLLADWPLRNWNNEALLPFHRRAVSSETLELFSDNSPEPRLLADLRVLFAEIDQRVESAVSAYYPKNPDGSYPWGYLWATTIPCDRCQRRFPLLGFLALRHPYASTSDAGQALTLVTDESSGTWKVKVVEGAPTGRPTFSAAEGRKGKSARCPFPSCGHVHSLDTVKAKGFAGQYEDAPLAAADLMTVTIVSSKRRQRSIERKVFRELRPDEIAAAININLAAQAPFGPLPASPTEAIAPGNADSVRGTGYGLKTWAELMNARQVVLFIETVRAIRSCHSDMREAGITEEYAAALTSFAAATLVRRLKRSTRGAPLEAYGDRPAVGVGHIFAQEAKVSFGFDWFETGPGPGAGTWESVASSAITVLRNHLSALTASTLPRPARFRRASATALPYRDGTVDAVVTDPPYYSMIDYADVSDLFYVWLRRCLFDILPDLFGEPGDELGLQDKSQEIIVKRSPIGTDHRTSDWYEAELSAAFAEIRRVLKPGGTLTVVFGHSDPAAWRRLLGALRDARFVVTGAWPARTESANTGVASIKVTMTIGCRTAPDGRRTATAAQVEREIGELVRKRVPHWDRWGLALWDQLMASYGPSMQVAGRYRNIQRPDGTEPDLDHFLTVGRRAVVDAHAFKIDELPLDTFDPQTRFAIFWLRAFGRTIVNKGEAVFHAQSSEMRIDQLRPHIISEAKGGFTLTLSPPAAVTERSSIIEVARALAAGWTAGGTEGAAQVIVQSGHPGHDAHLWATVAELVRQLPESDRMAVALTACQRNRRPIEMAARQGVRALDQDMLTFGEDEA